MEYSIFLRLLLTYERIDASLSELADIGMDFYEGKYKLSDLTYMLFISSFEQFYTKEGIEWIEWFLFEADSGKKDFNKNRKEGEPHCWGATNKDGNPIAYSYESLWKLLEKEYKIK